MIGGGAHLGVLAGLDNAVDGDGGDALAIGDGAEHRLQGTEGIFLAARDGAGIGEVRGRSVEAHQLGGHGPAGDVEDREGLFHLLFSLQRSEEHTSELQSLMRISYAVFCLKKKNITSTEHQLTTINKNSHIIFSP